MTAQEQMKKMLDELMGTQRDGARPGDDLKFTDDRVCKSYLMGLCPHELFNNTKMDLGPCNKLHAAALKADFELASKKRDYGYDIDQMEHLQSFIKDCDRKIQIAKKRLEETQDDQENVPEAQAVQDLAEQIGKKLAEAESKGAEGLVEESMALMREIEDLKAKKRIAEDIYRETLPSSSLQQQKLRVCEVCAAYLSLYDNDRRLADHFGGKLHMGFIKIRERLKELQDGVAKKRTEREMERQRRREEREREREREKREREKRMREREKERDRRRRRRSRSRSRSRDRRRRRRSRSGDKRSRSRSKSRSHSRSRSRSASKSASKSKASRRRGSRSKSRSRSRSPPRRKSRSGSPRKRPSPSRSRSRSRS